MDLEFTAEEEAFRAEVRAFLREHLPPEDVHKQSRTTSVFAEPDVPRRWQKALNARGWVAPSWPREYGGPGWTPAQRYIFENETAAAGVPSLSHGS